MSTSSATNDDKNQPDLTARKVTNYQVEDSDNIQEKLHLTKGLNKGVLLNQFAV